MFCRLLRSTCARVPFAHFSSTASSGPRQINRWPQKKPLKNLLKPRHLAAEANAETASPSLGSRLQNVRTPASSLASSSPLPKSHPSGPKKKASGALINDRIRARSVRLIADDGQQLGVVSLSEALSQAKAKGLDLVQMGVAKGNGPVACKLLDYKQHQFLKKKSMKKQVKPKAEKEIQLGVTIAENDVRIKTERALKFLEKGHPVRVVLSWRRFQQAHITNGRQILQAVISELKAKGARPGPERKQNNGVIITLAPISTSK